MNPSDPTIVHPGECRTCYAWVRDNETMTDGNCMDCVAAAVDDDEDFDVREIGL
jgi:hypothetical protein